VIKFRSGQDKEEPGIRRTGGQEDRSKTGPFARKEMRIDVVDESYSSFRVGSIVVRSLGR
jgi:hypothetical protein